MKKCNILLILISMTLLNHFSLAKEVNSKVKSKIDPFFSTQWYLKNIGQEGNRKTADNQKQYFKGKVGFDIGWNTSFLKTTSKNEVIVAVIDSGVDINHADLKGRIWKNPKCNGSKKDRFCRGLNVLSFDDDIKDQAGHGTHIAGIIAANTNNGIGMSGMTPENIKIMPIKVWNPEDKKQEGFRYKVGEGKYYYITDLIAEGILFAIKNNVKVINISSGWPAPFQTKKLKKVLAYAEEKNVVIVAAAGNDNKEIPIFPCTAKSVICVGAVTREGKVGLSSNYGGRVDIYAPGEDILSIFPTSSCKSIIDRSSTSDLEKKCINEYVESRFLRITGYEKKSGTSFAAPIVTATVAMMKLQNPEMSVDQIKARLYSTATKLNDSKVYGSGMLSFKNAISREADYFVKPSFKELFSVRVKDDKTFSFSFPIKNLAKKIKGIKVKISFKQNYLKLDQSEFEIKEMIRGESTSLMIKGHVSSLKFDAFVDLIVEVTSNQFSATFSNGLSLNRDFYEMAGTDVFTLPLANISNVFKSGYENNSHTLIKVRDDDSNAKLSQFYFNIVKKKTTRVITLLSLNYETGKTKKTILKLKAKQKVRAIFFHDVNKDGVKDYILYGYDKDTGDIYLSFYNQELKPLFKNHYWSYSTKDFPLTFYNKGSKKLELEWTSVRTKDFGEMNLPTMLMNYKLPKEDSSGDMLNDIALESNGHIFYTLPEVQKDGSVKIKWRAFDDYNFIQTIMKKYKIKRNDNMTIFSLKRGDSINSFRALMMTGTNGLNRVVEISKDGYDLKTKLLYSGFMSIPFNNWDRVAGDNIFIAMVHRALMRQFVIGSENNSKKMLKANNWKDPLVNYKLSVKSGKVLTSFIESRFHLYAFSNDGSRYSLPVNRESSFPNVAFSELLQPLRKTKNPSFLIDSTTILGNQEYIMKLDLSAENKFSRPIETSFYFPKNCVRIQYVSTVLARNYVDALCLEAGAGLILKSRLIK